VAGAEIPQGAAIGGEIPEGGVVGGQIPEGRAIGAEIPREGTDSSLVRSVRRLGPRDSSTQQRPATRPCVAQRKGAVEG